MHLRWHFAQFFELIWWRQYLKKKNIKNYLHWKKAYWNAFLTETGVKFSAGCQILDAGCGPAGIFSVLTEQRVDALDPLLERYESELLYFHRADYPHVRFYALPLESFQPEYPYDAVFCLNAINHVANIDRSLDRLAAILKPGGHLVLSVDAHKRNWLQRLFQWVPADILHPHQHTRMQYEKMLMQRQMVLKRSFVLKKGRIFDYCLLVATRRVE